MAGTQIPSVDWPRRTAALTGNEDLLKQNPVGDATPQEERIPVSLLSDYVVGQINALTSFTITLVDNLDGTYDIDNGMSSIVIDTTADSNPITDSGGYFTGTDVEAALQELATSLAAISDNTSVVTDNSDGTYSHNDGNGTIVVIDTTADSNPIIDVGGFYTGTNVETALQEIGTDLAAINDFTSVLTDNADGTYSHNDGNGTIVVIDTTADSNPITDVGGFYTGTDVETALQEIGTDLAAINDFQSILTDNSDGTYSHNDGNGTIVVIDTTANSNPIIDAGGYFTGVTVEIALQELAVLIQGASGNTSSITDNSNGTYTHNDGTGTLVIIDTTADSNPITDVGGFYTGTDVETALQEIGTDLATINDFQSILTDNSDGTYSHNDGNGTIVVIDTTADSNPIIDAGTYFTGTTVESALQELAVLIQGASGNTSSITDNADGTYTHNDGTGTLVIIDTTADSNPIINATTYYTGTTVETALDQLATAIQDLAASGTTSSITDNADGTYTHNDGLGNLSTIDTTADSNPIIDVGSYYTGTTVENALQEIGSIVSTVSGEVHTDGTILWVTQDGGDNSTAERGNMHKPFSDPWAARDAASEGDLIYTLNGQWTFGGVASGADIEGTMDTLNLFTGFTTGIHYYFAPNTSFTHVNSGQTITGTSSIALFDDVSGLNCSVRGYLKASFAESTATNSIVHIDNNDGLHIFEFEEVTYTNFAFSIFKASNVDIKINKLRPADGSISFFSLRERATVSGMDINCYVKDYYGSETDSQGLISTRTGGADVILQNSNLYFKFDNVYKEEQVGATSYVGKVFGLSNDAQLNESSFTVDCKNLQYRKTSGSIATGSTDFQQAAIQVGAIQLSGSSVTYNIDNCISDFCCIRVLGCTASESGFAPSFINVNGIFVSNESFVIHLDSLANPSGNGADKHIGFNGLFLSKDREVVGDARDTKEEAQITISGKLKTEIGGIGVCDLTEPIALKDVILENDSATAPLTTSNGSNLDVLCMSVFSNSLVEGVNILENISPIIRDTLVRI